MNTWPFLVAAGFGGAGVLAWAAYHPRSELFGPAVSRLASTSHLALTFDDGPNPAVTPRLLDVLDSHHARATFFLIGRWARACPDIVREIAARGHAIGNHTDTHPNVLWLPTPRIVDELVRCQQSIESIVGWRPTLVRPPLGYRGPQFRSAVERSGLGRVVTWSIAGYDWSPRGKRMLTRRLARVRGADILLLHDGSPAVLRADRTPTLDALEHWLPRWRDAGLRCVSLE